MRHKSLLLLLLVILAESCSSKIIMNRKTDGSYDSEFPSQSSSHELREISETVKLISSIAYYKSYSFSLTDSVKKSSLNKFDSFRKVRNISTFERPASGTALLISASGGNATFLTCAHIINFPDTLLSYFSTEPGKKSDYIESISVKTGQSNYIPEYVINRDIEILDKDDRLDLAILGSSYEPADQAKIYAFQYPCGRAEELEWGDFVYIFGYPLNQKMLTSALVSSPGRDRSGSFYLDACINRGFSGGIVLAARNGVPNFELVGMISLVPAEYNDVLRPRPTEGDAEYNPAIPYTAETFADRDIKIVYGVAKATPIETITSYLKSREKYLLKRGYSISDFLSRKPDKKQ